MEWAHDDTVCIVHQSAGSGVDCIVPDGRAVATSRKQGSHNYQDRRRVLQKITTLTVAERFLAAAAAHGDHFGFGTAADVLAAGVYKHNDCCRRYIEGSTKPIAAAAGGGAATVANHCMLHVGFPGGFGGRLDDAFTTMVEFGARINGSTSQVLVPDPDAQRRTDFGLEYDSFERTAPAFQADINGYLDSNLEHFRGVAARAVDLAPCRMAVSMAAILVSNGTRGQGACRRPDMPVF